MSENINPLQQLLDQWDLDSIMDPTEPGKEILNIPKLHAKYLRILIKHSALSKSTDQKLISLKKEKLDYYNGRMSQEELEKRGWKPFKFILKTDIKEYIDADKEILELTRIKSIHDEMVTCCQSILREINNRSYALKSYIDWEKFIQGQ